MSESMWDASARDLLARTASSEPTPGGGSIAAICGSLGIALIQMALEITGDLSLEPHITRLAALRNLTTAAADDDVRDFATLMSAYRLPKDDVAQRQARRRQIEIASIAATKRPLSLAAALNDALALSRELAPLVKPGILSDVLAGQDLVRGAARAAIRTADINLDQLVRRGSPAAADLRARRDALMAKLEESL